MSKELVKLVETTNKKLKESYEKSITEEMDLSEIDESIEKYADYIGVDYDGEHKEPDEEGKKELIKVYDAFKKQGFVFYRKDGEQTEVVEKPTMNDLQKIMYDFCYEVEKCFIDLDYSIDGEDIAPTYYEPGDSRGLDTVILQEFAFVVPERFEHNGGKKIKMPSESVLFEMIEAEYSDKISDNLSDYDYDPADDFDPPNEW